ncbi:hypothetical protein CVT24_003438 [Panaeolus cyanescens]|uniref:Uncharacterized protein n=1 Tax=Panaeolus cyanescens TaxID=181874 RepID=A0A409Y6W2_9AGAR|nr:hypothetical protein CVT24_003438 [Panaeolus cyanescens]
MNKDLFASHLRRRGPNFMDRLGELMKHTTHLAYIIDVYYTTEECSRLKKLIEYSPKIQDLAIWHYEALWKVHEAVIKLSGLKRLSASFYAMSKEKILLPTYLGLTHLEIIEDIEPSLISYFQNLTHLCLSIPCNRWRETCDQATDKEKGCRSLRVLVLFWEGFGDVMSHIYPDQRCVVLLDQMKHEVNWMEGAEGNIDFWEFAERIVIAREKKYLLPYEGGFEGVPIDEQSFLIEDDLTEEGQLWWIQRKANPDVPYVPNAPIKYIEGETLSEDETSSEE